MILPKKHLKLSESLLGLGAYLLAMLDIPSTLDELYSNVQYLYTKGILPAKHNMDNIILALDFLFMVGAISLDDEGRIHRAVN